jgi:hypothetical protein
VGYSLLDFRACAVVACIVDNYHLTQKFGPAPQREGALDRSANIAVLVEGWNEYAKGHANVQIQLSCDANSLNFLAP